MIEYLIICKSNHWPARMQKISFILKKIIKYENELKFSKKIDYKCNIILTDNKLVKKINNKFRNINQATDVLTFVSNINFTKLNKQKICDIFISANILKKEAENSKISFYDHFCHIIIHSFLHINGFDHKKNKDFIKMKKIEILILDKLGIKNPYFNIS